MQGMDDGWVDGKLNGWGRIIGRAEVVAIVREVEWMK